MKSNIKKRMIEEMSGRTKFKQQKMSRRKNGND